MRAEAWPSATNADELHDALLGLAFVTEQEVAGIEPWRALLVALVDAGRATRLSVQRTASAETTTTGERALWIAAERLPQFRSVYPDAQCSPTIDAPEEFAARAWSARGRAGGDRARPPRRA